MARKFELDSSITKDIKSVASDSFIDSIKMLDIELIKPSSDNFFSLSDIETLAEDIERQGLKHNLVVCEDKDQRGTYWLKSGHRRFEAIRFLINENRLTNKTVPCLVDGIKSKAENMLDLIMLNATTRVMSDAEIIQQYETLEKTYKELEAEGKKFKGRLRERIADALNVSPAQAGKIENINHNAIPEIKQAVSQGDMSISTANEIAKMDETEQKELVEHKAPAEITHKEVKEKQEDKPKKVSDSDNEKTVPKPEKSGDNFFDKVEKITEKEKKNPTPKIDNIDDDYDYEKYENEEIDNDDDIEDNHQDQSDGDIVTDYILTISEVMALMKHLPKVVKECYDNYPGDYLILRDLMKKFEEEN